MLLTDESADHSYTQMEKDNYTRILEQEYETDHLPLNYRTLVQADQRSYQLQNARENPAGRYFYKNKTHALVEHNTIQNRLSTQIF